MRKDDVNKIYEIIKDVWWIGFNDYEAGFSNNPYLIIDGDEAVLIDPGPGHPIFRDIILQKIQEIIDPMKIKYVVVHHQDPDLCGLLPYIENFCYPDIVIIAHPRTALFLPYYGIRKSILSVGDNDVLQLNSGRKLRFIHIPYVHFAGNMFTYDEKEKILFSSDLFGSYKKEWDLYADTSHIAYIKNFIDHYVESKDAVMYAYNKIRELEIKMILPQHGGIIKEELVNEFIEILPKTEPGALIRELNEKPDKENTNKIIQEGIQWFKMWLNKSVKPDNINDLLIFAQEEGPAALALLFDVISTKSKELGITNPLSFGRVISWDTVKKSKSSQLVESIRNRYLKSQYSMNYGDEKNIDQLLLRRLSAVKQECAIMFIDIRGFSKWSIDKNADEIISFLNKEHELVSKIINTSGGRVNKILGDGLLAYFLPEKIDSCIQVAYNIQMSINKNHLLPAGIGLDFGEVILGDIGQESRLDYSLIGSVVNQASRYCSVALGNQIGISEIFFNKLAPEIQKQIKTNKNFKRIEVHVKAGDPVSSGFIFQVE